MLGAAPVSSREVDDGCYLRAVAPRYTLTCVTTYTDMNGNNRIDLFKEVLSITNISCTVTRNR